MAESIAIIIPVVAVIVILFFILLSGITIIKEREVMIIERLGAFSKVLTAGVHYVVPFVDRSKKYYERYYLTEPTGTTRLVSKYGLTRISTQSEVIDFPKQNVITRDNASVFLDAVLSYRIINPKQMIYKCQNLPLILSKLLQAQLRNVSGGLDIDQIIEESAALNVLTSLMDQEASRWGIKIEFVKISQISVPGLEDVLAKKKNADLQNQEIIITAKAKKQKQVIESEGQRDSMIKTVEGQAQERISQARGYAQAILNKANAEARSIKEIARALLKDGKDPTKYLLATKYMESIEKIMNNQNTEVQYLPKETSFLQTVQGFGFNTVIPANIRN
jgi:regulator of protease activity HflC (stomatin/prohibitin superfamily)